MTDVPLWGFLEMPESRLDIRPGHRHPQILAILHRLRGPHMTDHYIAHMQSEIRELRLERDLLHAKVAQLEARENRVRDRVAQWRTDDAESLTLFGQHAAASLAVLADQIDNALTGGSDGG